MTEKRWCYGCNETKELNSINFAWADKAHTKYRNKCRKCTNFDSKISHRIHYEERKERALKRKEVGIVMSKEIERGFAYQPNEPTPDKPSEILIGISFGGVNYIDVEDYKKLQEVLKNTYETGREIACELEKENQQLKSVLNEVREYIKANTWADLTFKLYLNEEEVDKVLEILDKVGGSNE